MIKKFTCEICQGEFSFYDCAELGLNGKKSILCWSCIQVVVEELQKQEVYALVSPGLEKRFGDLLNGKPKNGFFLGL